MLSAAVQSQRFAPVEIQVRHVVAPISRHGAANSCECLSCQTGRPDYPCLIEDDHAR